MGSNRGASDAQKAQQAQLQAQLGAQKRELAQQQDKESAERLAALRRSLGGTGVSLFDQVTKLG